MPIRVTTHVFPAVFSQLVLHELDPRYSRETVQVAAGTALPLGCVLYRKTDGTYDVLKEATPEGENQVPALSGTASAVLITPLEAATAARTAVVLRGYCLLNSTKLVLDASVTTKKQTALQNLHDAGFILQEVPENADA